MEQVIMGSKTTIEYAIAVKKAKDIFSKKLKDYGTAWRILRSESITDQIFIKAQRIRTIEQKGNQMVDEGIEPEFIGIVNYSVIALIQLELGGAVISNSPKDIGEISGDKALSFFNKHIAYAEELMMAKNHDYGEAWRDMRMSSFTDLILMKLLRVKQIEENEGETLISEGIDASYYDIINYAIFALIKLEERVNS